MRLVLREVNLRFLVRHCSTLGNTDLRHLALVDAEQYPFLAQMGAHAMPTPVQARRKQY
jgi:hypothetical protein